MKWTRTSNLCCLVFCYMWQNVRWSDTFVLSHVLLYVTKCEMKWHICVVSCFVTCDKMWDEVTHLCCVMFCYMWQNVRWSDTFVLSHVLLHVTKCEMKWHICVVSCFVTCGKMWDEVTQFLGLKNCEASMYVLQVTSLVTNNTFHTWNYKLGFHSMAFSIRELRRFTDCRKAPGPSFCPS